jgi:hypothetical protein
MPNSAKALGKVRGLIPDLLEPSNADEQQINLTGQGEAIYVHSASFYGEDVRNGRTYWTNNSAAVAAVIAMPTTAHNVAIQNNEPDGGRSLIIQRVSAHSAVAGAVLYQACIIACLGQTREAILAASALTFKQCNGGGGKDTRVRVIAGGTAITGVAATNWFCLSDNVNTSTASVGGWAIDVNVDGQYIVPPGRFFAVHVLASAIGLTPMCQIYWTEKQLLLG